MPRDARGIRQYAAVDVRPRSGALLCKALIPEGSVLPDVTLDRLRQGYGSAEDWQELLGAYEALRSARIELGSTQCKRMIYKHRPELKQRGLLVLHYVDPATGAIDNTRVILDPQPHSAELSRSGIRLDNAILEEAVSAFKR